MLHNTTFYMHIKGLENLFSKLLLMISFVQVTNQTNMDELIRRLTESVRNLSSQFQKPVTTHFISTLEYLKCIFLICKIYFIFLLCV